MCTLSVMLLAASVRRISAVISSSDGICSNASACAERRSLARCSSSRKIRPLYSRRPSHTASPPCTTESNGLTAAWSRCVSRPATLTIRSRLRSSKVCSMRVLLAVRAAAGGRPVRRRTAGTAAASGARSGGRSTAAAWVTGPNPVDRQTLSYQYRAQTPSVGRGPAGQDSIAGSKRDAERIAERLQRRARVRAGCRRSRSPGRRTRGRSRPAAPARDRPATGRDLTLAYEASSRRGSRIRNACVSPRERARGRSPGSR